MKADAGILKYVNDRIWNVRLEDRNKYAAFLFKQLRIVLIVVRNYTRNKLQLQAAGLTFYTLLSVVPLVALIFAIAKGFGFEDALEKQLLSSFAGHEEVAEQIFAFATNTLENTQGGVLAGIGVVLLLWTVMRLLSNIEMAFNEIWHVVKGRSWIRKFTEYFSIMLLAPILIILSGSLTVVVTTEIENLVAGFNVLQQIGPVIHFGLRMIPYVLIWLLFTFVYMVMPNTKVSFGSALVAGIIAGTSFQILEWAYINFQVGVSKYNAIYGSFAALPLFMVWANFSWLITLVGAEVAYANQYVSTIENEIDGEQLSNAQRHVLAQLIMRKVEHSFDHDGDPLTLSELSDQLNLPFGVTSKIVDLLVEAKVLTEVERDDDSGMAYLPLHSLEKMSAVDIVSAIDRAGHTPIPAIETDLYKPYFDQYDLLVAEMRNSEHNKALKDLPEIDKKHDD